MTTASLKDKRVRDLARLAKQHGVSGWHSMRKDQLIKALVRKAKGSLPRSSGDGEHRQGVSPAVAVRTAPSCDPRVAARIAEARDRLSRVKDLATRPEQARGARRDRDRLVLMVRGPHWLHAFWEVTSRSIDRARAALGQEWHAARPVLRVVQLDNEVPNSPAEKVIREIEVHGGVKNWFIDVRDPLRCRVELGYRAASGRFHALGRSNAVNTPVASQGDTLDAHWGDIAGDCDRIYSLSGGFAAENGPAELQELFEERLRRPMSPPNSRHAVVEPEEPEAVACDCELQVDAEMVIYGATRPDAYVTLHGEPVKLAADGTFRVRVEMPNRRQVIPIVASAPEAGGRRTVVLAVERNTKTMEPYGRDSGEY
jgi:hypothetical protein